MTTDILASIDATLADWERDSEQDAMRWAPALFPSLPATQQDTVRQVAHDTGLDGYAAWLAVADVQEFGSQSPYAGWVWPEGRELAAGMYAQGGLALDAMARAGDQVRMMFGQIAEAFRPVAQAYANYVGNVMKNIASSVHKRSAAQHPRQHIRCCICWPFANPKPSVNGREYHRRQRARRRRARH